VRRVQVFTGRAVCVMTLVAMCATAVFSQEQETDLADLSLESLLNMRVTSVSRRQEEMRKTAAAVFVITQEDIRRSGATDIADLLRMVPGVDVAQLTSNTWAVSVRGFNGLYATKLLVQVDGRTVYDPTFSGVFWDRQNLVLEDIDRIEVIRGPGATMWGANAVNGVISITTKRAGQTQGGLLVATGGSRRPGEGAFRFGGELGQNAFYRASARQTTRTNSPSSSGENGGDSWNMTDATFRVDWDPSGTNSFVFDGGGYRGVTSNPLASFGLGGQGGKNGGHALARWTHSLSSSSDLRLQFYYNNSQINGAGGNNVDLLDFDAQHNFHIGNRNNVMWGVGHRRIHDDVDNTLTFKVLPAHKTTTLSNAFVQDEITVIDRTLYVTVGSKFERSSFTGYDIQPSAHLLWLPDSRQSVWASASRAVRTANRIERGLHIDLRTVPMGPVNGIVTLSGRDDTRSEELMAYEAGYRYQAMKKVWFDLATFYNVYDHLSTTEQGAPFFVVEPGPPHFVVPTLFGNGMKGKTYGAEVTGNLKVNDSLTFRGSYSLLHMSLQYYRPDFASTSETAEGQSPRNQVYGGVVLTLPKSFELSGHSYFVGQLPTFQVPSYTRVDANVTWKGLEHLELSVAGQNLLGSHMEFGTGQGALNPVNRNIYGKVTWRF
jgi:iron complex outermembrane recepter protein